MTKTRFLAIGGGLIVIASLAFFLLRAEKESRPSSVVTLRLESFAIGLNPVTLSDTESRRVATMLHLGLVRVNHDGSVMPGIASEWKHVDRKTTFKIKEKTTFNDGSPITPDEVRDSLCRTMQPASLFNWSLASIEHTVSADGKTVTCTGISAKTETGEVEILESVPKPWLLEALAGPGGWITKAGVVPTQYGNVPGAGPYRLGEVVPDSSVTLLARDGGPIRASASKVSFLLIKDDAQAAFAYRSGKLDAIDVTNPTLAGLLNFKGLSGPDGDQVGSVKSDRLRVLIVGKKSLAAKGYSPSQVEALQALIDAQFDREKLVGQSPGLVIAAPAPFPFPARPENKAAPSVGDLPASSLIVITESDAYSDFIASMVPKSIGATRIDYKGVDKGLLIDKIVRSDFDIASVIIEGTLHAPEFWISFFKPGSPFTVFGESLEDLRTNSLTTERDIATALATIAQKGNWIGLVQEQKLVLFHKSISGVRFTPAGQVSYEQIGRK